MFLLEWLRRLQSKVGLGMTKQQKLDVQGALTRLETAVQTHARETKDMLEEQNRVSAKYRHDNTNEMTAVKINLAVINTRMGIKAGRESKGELPE